VQGLAWIDLKLDLFLENFGPSQKHFFLFYSCCYHYARMLVLTLDVLLLKIAFLKTNKENNIVDILENDPQNEKKNRIKVIH